MVERPAVQAHPVFQVLAELHYAVVNTPAQPLHQFAEAAVLHWTRVVEGLEVTQPRLQADGEVPGGFHYGMEPDAANRLDPCGVEAGRHGFEPAWAARLDHLGERLERYFAHEGYRSSSDQCDQLMVELARCSRFLGIWALEAEREAAQRRTPAPWTAPPLHGYEPGTAGLLPEVRLRLAFWEPLLHDAIVAWEQNALESFDRALRELYEALLLSEGERAAVLQPPGYPFRARRSHRLKMAVVEQEQRPLRGRSVFNVRSGQLLQILEEAQAGGFLDKAVADAVETDARHFLAMVLDDRFMLASEAGFSTRGRAGVPTIRERPRNHPLFLDPVGFFKHAVLFHNGTFTVEGGGHDRVYLQFRQLERYLKFEPRGALARLLRQPVERCLVAWEENRREAFTAGMLTVAELLRDTHEQHRLPQEGVPALGGPGEPGA